MTKRYLYNKKWRNKNRSKWNESKAINYKKGAANQKNSKTEWTVSENERITGSDRPTDRVLATELERTVRAIQIQRCRLKKPISI